MVDDDPRPDARLTALTRRTTGEELTVAFNPDYLLSGVDVTPGDEITLHTVDAQKPAVIRASGADEFLYLLMPVRVS